MSGASSSAAPRIRFEIFDDNEEECGMLAAKVAAEFRRSTYLGVGAVLPRHYAVHNQRSTGFTLFVWRSYNKTPIRC